MGLSSSNEIKHKSKDFKDEIKNEPVEIKDEITEPGNYSYCFKEREISYIEELKEKKTKTLKMEQKKEETIFFFCLKK